MSPDIAYFGRLSAEIEKSGSIRIGKDQFPWLNQPIDVNISSIKFKDYPLFFYGSAIRGHGTLLSIANKMNSTSSTIVNRSVYLEIANVVTASCTPPILKNGLVHINYSKHNTGARGYFTSLDVRNGDTSSKAFILIAACASKNQEPDIHTILNGSRGSSGAK